ncbi:PIN domain-containing protein [Ekhidna sp.]|uniref:PIN domain-containing protein n=1 Tax=Ekhidna sp. TaxID=2608089 RepID=UPI0032EAF8FD
MKIVVDTNIVFSALLNSKSTISDLILNSSESFSFYSPSTILAELKEHEAKLLKISGLSERELEELKIYLFKHIHLISLETLSNESWSNALNLVEDVDPADTPFVALAIELNSKLWTGDKKLKKGIASQRFDSILDTKELHKLRDK